MKTLRWIFPALAIALLPLWGCETDDGEQGSDTTIIEDTEPDIIVEDQQPDVIIDERKDTIIDTDDGVRGEVRVGEDGVSGEVKVEENR